MVYFLMYCVCMNAVLCVCVSCVYTGHNHLCVITCDYAMCNVHVLSVDE